MRKYLALILMICLAVVVCISAAEENVIYAENPLITGELDTPIDADEAAEDYILRAFGLKKDEIRLRSAALPGANNTVYLALANMAQQVAEGNQSSTRCEIPVTSIVTKTRYTKEELNVGNLIEGNQITQAAKEAFYGRVAAEAQLNIPLVIQSLVSRVPYNMYWFGNIYSYGFPGCGSDGSSIYFIDNATYQVDLIVSVDYSVGHLSETTNYDLNYGTRVQQAAENAQAIVTANERKTDYQKLEAYRIAICNAVSYNDTAANNDNTPYGDPWQAVSVFDNDDNTNVVCEGYSKAFKYLCDLSQFRSPVSASIVSGFMQGGTGAGRHMWNLVNMNGTRYLVDVTNCDEGTIGAPDKLFMAGYHDTYASGGLWGYVYLGNGDTPIVYLYNTETAQLYSEEELTVSNTDYVPTESNWAPDYDINSKTLVITGSGSVSGYTNEGDAPWIQENKEIERVVVEAGITSIGANVFGGLNGTVRIDFLQTEMPTISEDAFGTTTAVCRYYSTDSSWDAATDTETVTWIDLPASLANNDAPLELRYRVNNNTSEGEWAIGPRTNSYNNSIAVRVDQAKEITYNDRWVVFEDIPTATVSTAEADKAVYEGLDAPTVLLFMEGTSGTYSINFTGKPAKLRWVECRSWGGLNLTITAPAGNTLEELVVCDANQVTYSGDIDTVTLKTTQRSTPTVTISGDIDELTYYDASSDSPFKGTVTVDGTISRGTVHSQSSLYVPGISATDDPIEFGDIAAYTFENIEQETPVITLTGEGANEQESRLTIGNETVQPTRLSLDKFTFSYSFYSDRIAFSLFPKAGTGLGSYSADIDNILETGYNPGFTTADIIQGPDTTVYVRNTGTGENAPTIAFGNTDAGNTQSGVDSIYLENCKAEVNWPANLVMVWQYSYADGPVELEINSRVANLDMFLNRVGGRIQIGEAGSVAGGYWDRGIRGMRYFSPVSGGTTIAENGNLHLMTYKSGERTVAMPADDETVTTAAGNLVPEGQFASMDVQDASLADLDEDDQTALSTYLTDNGLTEENIANVFDVSIAVYEWAAGSDSLTKGNSITSLDSAVDVSVRNNTGSTVKVLRLHDGVATELPNKSNSTTVCQFASNEFSTYLLIADDICEHDFEDGVCILCGYECQHEDRYTFTSWDWTSKNYHEIEGDDQYHITTGLVSTGTHCNICGLETYEPYQETTETEYHSYQHLQCMDCGHLCPHTDKTGNTTWSEVTDDPITEYVRINKTQHAEYRLETSYNECSICHGRTGEHVNRQFIKNENHVDTDEDGICDICMKPINAVTIEGEFNESLGILTISGNGEMADYSVNDPAPWQKHAGDIQQIIIEEGVTRIGNYAFADLSGTVRVDFNEKVLPTIAENAFSGTTAKCRYYTEDSSWTAAENYGGTLDWIYLPLNYEENHSNDIIYHEGDGWSVQIPNSSEWINFTTEQAAEYTWKSRAVTYFQTPNKDEDWALCQDSHVYFISFQAGCVGTKALDLQNISGSISIDLFAPNMTLNITEGTGEAKISTLSFGAGKVNCDGSIGTVNLGQYSKGTQNDRVTIDGDVNRLEIYDNTTEIPYKGSARIKGTITSGAVRGTATIAIPKIGNEIPFGNLTKATFENVSQPDSDVVSNGMLTIDGVTPIGELTWDMFRLSYSQLGPDKWCLSLDPKPDSGLNGFGGFIDNILDYNKRFTVNDIIWGEDTSVSFWLMHDQDPIVLNGETDQDGNMVGLGSVGARDVNLIINCPVEQLIINQLYPEDVNGPVNCQINAPVDTCVISIHAKGSGVTLGAGGSIRYGNWDRGILPGRNFDSISCSTGTTEIYSNNQLMVMSRKPGESTEALFPTEDEMKEAAGITSEAVSVQMDISDSSVESLESGETTALAEYLTDNHLPEENVVSVFEASMASYADQGGTMTKTGDISVLNTPVQMTINNPAPEEECIVVRLHKTGDSISAESVSSTADQETIQVSSDLFSKFAIIKNRASDDGIYEFILPSGTITIDAEAFAGIKAKSVRLSDNCQTIGERAFAESELEKIYIPASVTSIGANALPTNTVIYMPVENAISAQLRTLGYDVRIVPQTGNVGE